MNYHAAEQMARHQYEQLAREAHGDHLIGLARGDATELSQATVGPLPVRRVASLMRWLRGVVLTGTSGVR